MELLKSMSKMARIVAGVLLVFDTAHHVLSRAHLRLVVAIVGETIPISLIEERKDYEFYTIWEEVPVC